MCLLWFCVYSDYALQTKQIYVQSDALLRTLYEDRVSVKKYLSFRASNLCEWTWSLYAITVTHDRILMTQQLKCKDETIIDSVSIRLQYQASPLCQYLVNLMFFRLIEKYVLLSPLLMQTSCVTPNSQNHDPAHDCQTFIQVPVARSDQEYCYFPWMGC